MQIDVGLYYEKYGPMVYRRCKMLLKNDALAYEAMQDTFVKLITYQNRLNDQGPSSLLFKMATQICLNTLRKKSEILMDDSDSENQTMILKEIISHDRPEETALSRDFLRKLFGTQQESALLMAVLFYLDEMTLEEISQEVGMSISGVRKRLRIFNKNVKLFKELQ